MGGGSANGITEGPAPKKAGPLTHFLAFTIWLIDKSLGRFSDKTKRWLAPWLLIVVIMVPSLLVGLVIFNIILPALSIDGTIVAAIMVIGSGLFLIGWSIYRDREYGAKYRDPLWDYGFSSYLIFIGIGWLIELPLIYGRIAAGSVLVIAILHFIKRKQRRERQT